MKRLGTCAVLLSMIAAVVVSAGYLRGVRMQRVVPATVPPDERIFRARLLFAGDVMAHLPQLTAARRSDGTHDFFGQFRLVKPRFDAADLVVVNLETTLSAAAPHTGYPCFRTPSRLRRPSSASLRLPRCRLRAHCSRALIYTPVMRPILPKPVSDTSLRHRPKRDILW